MYNHYVINELKETLKEDVSRIESVPPSDLEHMFFVLLLESLENTNLREHRYDILYILLCYSALSKRVELKIGDNKNV